MTRTRCINIDWLEVHCIEPREPRDADYFRSLGFEVSEREFGTRVYEQMFTIYTPDGQPFVEVRRSPHKTNDHDKFQVLEIGSCHLRLHNRTCYFNDAGKLMEDFINRYGFTFRRIAKIDICLDFEKFDSGDSPAAFVRRYLKGKYAKVNQCNISMHGKDCWDGQEWNSLSWGSKKSPIFTRLYNKTLELKEVKDKPYIRQAWASSGLVDDFIQLTKRNEKGEWYKPEIWRLEFSIASSVRNWVCFDVDENGNKTHRSLRNDLSRYRTRRDLETMFNSLVKHYFHFKHLDSKDSRDQESRERCIKSKYDCPDKVLFTFQDSDEVYKVEKLAAAKVDNKALLALKNKLCYYKQTHVQKSTQEACNAIIEAIDKEMLVRQAVNPHDETEIELLQRLIAYRINGQSQSPLSVDKEFVESLIELSGELF